MSLAHKSQKGAVVRDEDPFMIAGSDNVKLKSGRLFRAIPLLAAVIPPSDLLPVIKYINKRRKRVAKSTQGPPKSAGGIANWRIRTT